MFRVFSSEGLLMESQTLTWCLGLPLCSFKNPIPETQPGSLSLQRLLSSFLLWEWIAGLWKCHSHSCLQGLTFLSGRSLCWTIGKAGLSQIGRSPVPLHGHLEKWSKNWYSATILDLHQTPLYPSKLLMISTSPPKQRPRMPPRAFRVSARGLTLALGSLHTGYYATNVSLQHPPQKLWAK